MTRCQAFQTKMVVVSFFLDWMKTMTLKQLVSTILKICNGKLKINVDKCNHP